MTEINFNKLKAPFPSEKISWRVGATTKEKTKGIALAYIDARDVMERLDEVCGVSGWQVKYSHANGKTIADIGIKIDDEWVWKASGAGDTQVEAEKGAISDALKRAAVVWGIGRYLYDVENIWVELDNYRRIQNPTDPRLAKALDKAAQGIRTQDPPRIGMNMGADDVAPEVWMSAKIENLYDYIKKPKSSMEKLAEGDMKTRQDAIFKKIIDEGLDELRDNYEIAIKDAEQKLKQRLEKETA